VWRVGWLVGEWTNSNNFAHSKSRFTFVAGSFCQVKRVIRFKEDIFGLRPWLPVSPEP